MADVNSKKESIFSHKTEDPGNFDYNRTAVHDSKLMNEIDLSSANSFGSEPKNKTVANGPVVENIKDQSEKAQTDFSNLAATRIRPAYTAATGQPLTQYHSFFYSLLSWEHPRASGVAYIFTVLLTFAVRYLNIIRYSLKITYVILGITVLAEIIGKLLFSHGFTTQVRPKRYYIVSRETLNLLIGDLHELINFFVIQSQQVIFAENLSVSIAAFIFAFISYFLVKFVPLWVLFLLGTSALFLGTLAYKANQEMVDHHVASTAEIINKQTEKLKNLASEQAIRATKQTKALVGDYSVKAQGMITSGRSPLSSPLPPVKSLKTDISGKEVNSNSFKSEDFPKAPIEEPKFIKSVDARETSLIEDPNLIAA